MGKIKPHNIDRKEKQEIITELFRVIDKIKSKEELVSFFLGVLTASESLMLARRIQIAQLLIEEMGYEEIQRKLKVGSQTIHKIDQWINTGDRDLEKWLKNLIKKEDKKKKLPTYPERGMLNKYPFYRFWSDLFK